MPYYDTLDEDLVRAKQILAEGKMTEADLEGVPRELQARLLDQSGTIHGKDIYAAYKLLESFVAVIEQVRTISR